MGHQRVEKMRTNMPSSHMAARFWSDGVVFPLRVLSQSELSTYAAALGDLAIPSHDESVIRQLHLFYTPARTLALLDQVCDIMEDLIGPDLLVWGSMLACKPPLSPLHFPWHQDDIYRTVTGPATKATVWIALTDSQPDNGCVRMLAGSHLVELPHRPDQDANSMLHRSLVIVEEPDPDNILEVCLQAGEMSVHHGGIAHQSNGNSSNRWRRGFVVRFTTPDLEKTNSPLVIARGCTDCDHPRIWREPTYADPAEALAAQSRYMRSVKGDN